MAGRRSLNFGPPEHSETAQPTDRRGKTPALTCLPMDTLTHALSGALLSCAVTARHRDAAAAPAPKLRVFGPPVPLGQAVAVGFVAAAFPDADYVLKAVSDLAYLRGHRGLTHSLLLLPLWAALLGVLAATVLRKPAAWKRYAWLAGGGIGIHIAGDWITQFGTMLLAPFSDARFGLGSTFIIDLVLSGIIVAGLLASALFRRSRAPALVALSLLPMWIGVNLVGKSEALAFARDYAARQGIEARFVDAAPRPASPFNWTVLVFDGGSYHVAHVNTRRTAALEAPQDAGFIRRLSAPYQPLPEASWQRLPKFGADGDSALAQEVWRHPQFEFFRWFAMFPSLHAVENDGPRTCVWYRDLRFVYPGRGSTPFLYGMCRDDGEPWSLAALDDVAGRAALR
jgi:inner membrane protein